MKHSRKAARMARHHARAKNVPALNLTALMDIFTILVFFLMVNSGDEQLIKDTETILMPRSIAEEMPKESLLISVDATNITIQGQIVATIEEINAMKNESSEDDIIPALKAELDRQSARRTELTEEEKILPARLSEIGDMTRTAGLMLPVVSPQDLTDLIQNINDTLFVVSNNVLI